MQTAPTMQNIKRKERKTQKNLALHSFNTVITNDYDEDVEGDEDDDIIFVLRCCLFFCLFFN